MHQPSSPSTDPVPPSIAKYRPILTHHHHVSTSTAIYWPSNTKYQPEPPSTDPVPSYINQYHSILTQYQQVSTTTIKYQPVSPSTDPVPPNTNQYRLLLTQYHQLTTSTTPYWPSTTKYQPVPSSINQYRLLLTQSDKGQIQTALGSGGLLYIHTIVAWGLQTSAQFTLGLVCLCIYIMFLHLYSYQKWFSRLILAFSNKMR